MTLKEFTDMAHSCNSPITVTLFSDIESEEEFRLTKNARLVLLKFQYTYQTAVVLTSRFVNARVEAFYKDVLTAEGLIDSTKSVDPTTGSASVPVNVTREAATFSVVVPTTLPISVDADGNVTTATDATIINNSGATVAVTKVELNSQSNWTLAAYNRDILNLPVDAKQFGLQMNIGDKTVTTSNSGTSDILSDSLNAQITKGQNCAVTYNALFPARTAAVSDTQIANVVFTVGWA